MYVSNSEISSTEGETNGCLYRFRPTSSGNLSSGTLEVLVGGTATSGRHGAPPGPLPGRHGRSADRVPVEGMTDEERGAGRPDEWGGAAVAGQGRVESRAAHLLPEEEAAGSDDPRAQAAAILAESDLREHDPRAAPDTVLERRTSAETVPPAEPTD